MPLNNKISHHGKWAMALSGFEIAMGGISSIPVVGGLIFLGYKSFGESSLDASKLKPKQKTEVKKAQKTLAKNESFIDVISNSFKNGPLSVMKRCFLEQRKVKIYNIGISSDDGRYLKIK